MPVPRFDNSLTAFGVGANAYILRGKMKEIKGDLKGVTSEAKEMVSEGKEMDSEVNEMADNTRALAHFQAALELNGEAIAEAFFQNCVKEKLKFAEVDRSLESDE